MSTKIASGIFTWEGQERRSKRYGRIVCAQKDFNETDRAETFYNIPKELECKKVKLTAVVKQNRESGHCGDLFLDIFPSKPEIGEIIEIGVGILYAERTIIEDAKGSIELMPEDNRNIFWINPHKLYRLHDQTVDIFAELTDEECSKFELPTIKEPGAMGTGDGCIQVSEINIENGMKAKPEVKSLGNGLFSFETPSTDFGKRVTLLP